MIEILKSEKQKPIVREYAAVALGLIAGQTDPDPLFEIDAGFNHFATTTATHELVRLY